MGGRAAHVLATFERKTLTASFEHGPDNSSSAIECIVCPSILIPSAILAVELFEERRINDMELVRADTDNGP